MRESIKKFPAQFGYAPKIENSKRLKKYERFLVAGMGGSGLAADLLKCWDPALPIMSHKDYGLPHIPSHELKKTLVIANSYSGNTEETLSAFAEARKRGMDLAVISVGGKLLQLARKYGIPYIEMPDTGIQPRMALGFNAKAILKMMGRGNMLTDIGHLEKMLKLSGFEARGKSIARKLRGKVPVIYASTRNGAVAYTWKIKFNETGKIPAFANVLPELNHNEMTGLDVTGRTRSLSRNFSFILLKDISDNSRVQKRMKILRDLYNERGLPVETISIAGKNRVHAIFASIVLADWTALSLAGSYGAEAEQVPMVEEFKGLIMNSANRN